MFQLKFTTKPVFASLSLKLSGSEAALAAGKDRPRREFPVRVGLCFWFSIAFARGAAELQG
jgi:hypothetical protein